MENPQRGMLEPSLPLKMWVEAQLFYSQSNFPIFRPPGDTLVPIALNSIIINEENRTTAHVVSKP
jgi:hypothetical protein